MAQSVETRIRALEAKRAQEEANPLVIDGNVYMVTSEQMKAAIMAAQGTCIRPGTYRERYGNKP